MAGTIRLRFEPQEGKDYTGPATVVDSEGYTWNFGPNESRVLPDDGDRLTLASNATVAWGASTRQTSAPQVNADLRQQPART